MGVWVDPFVCLSVSTNRPINFQLRPRPKYSNRRGALECLADNEI